MVSLTITPDKPITSAATKTAAQLFAEETCTILVNGRKFSDWETVLVFHDIAEAYPTFKFSTADVAEVPMDWQLLQFKPGNDCGIYLGGQLAITGVIITRQVAYDANNHGVMLDGVGIQWWAHRASIVPEANEEVGNFDDMSFEEAARKVLAPTGIQLIPKGPLNPLKFPRLQSEPGETIWAFLERIARVRGIIMGSDELGNFIAIWKHEEPVTTSLIEGINIKKAQVTITVQDIYSMYIALGQTAANNQQNGTDASEQKGQVGGSSRRYSPKLTTAEQPVWGKAEIQDRAAAEAIWSEGTIIQAAVTVQGWMQPGTSTIWKAGGNVNFKSPMAMLDRVMKIQSVTFMQSRQGGTETVLNLVVPELLKDNSMFRTSEFNGETGEQPHGSKPAAPHTTFTKFPATLE
jgi:prophage tail gpP-like protein